MLTFGVTAVSPAPAAVLWRLLIDGRTWPTWAPIDSLVVDRSSGLDPNGQDPVGAVRAFRTGWMVTCERLTQLVENRQLVYEVGSNWAIRNYRAVVDLVPTSDGGTTVHWHGTYEARWGLDWWMKRVMPRSVQREANGLASHAATLPPPLTD